MKYSCVHRNQTWTNASQELVVVYLLCCLIVPHPHDIEYKVRAYLPCVLYDITRTSAVKKGRREQSSRLIIYINIINSICSENEETLLFSVRSGKYVVCCCVLIGQTHTDKYINMYNVYIAIPCETFPQRSVM